MHECMRVFFDRLATVEDREYFMQMLGGMVSRSFSGLGLNYEQCFGEGTTPMLWSGIQRNGIYDEIKDITKFQSLLNEQLGKKMLSPTLDDIIFSFFERPLTTHFLFIFVFLISLTIF